MNCPVHGSDLDVSPCVRDFGFCRFDPVQHIWNLLWTIFSKKLTNEFPNFSGTVYLRILSSPGAMDVSPCGKLSDFGAKIDPKRTRGLDQTAGNKQCFQNPSISFKFLGVWELRNGIFWRPFVVKGSRVSLVYMYIPIPCVYTYMWRLLVVGPPRLFH